MMALHERLLQRLKQLEEHNGVLGVWASQRQAVATWEDSAVLSQEMAYMSQCLSILTRKIDELRNEADSLYRAKLGPS
jgi:hypothetical protein